MSVTLPTAELLRTNRRIELTEWQNEAFALSSPQVDDLLRCPAGVLQLQLLPGGRTLLKPQSFVGQLRLGSVDLRIVPKCPMLSLLTMLAEVHELTELRPEQVGYEKQDSLVDLLIQMLLVHVDRVVLRGLKRTYVERDETLVSVRGRVDVRQTLGLHMRGLPRVQCRYDEYTLDCPENQLLLAALRAVVASPAVAVHRRDLAHRLAADFFGVQDVPPRGLLGKAPPTPDRLNAHYSLALQLADLVLRASGLLHELGATEANGFLIDMNRLFEVFVFRKLRTLLARHGVQTRGQVRQPFDRDRQLQLRPDLLFRHPSGRRLVADTKYKLGVEPRSGDLYQMLAYCRVLGVRQGLLICLGTGSLRKYVVRDGGTTITVVAVDLSGDPEQLQASLRRLALLVRAQLDREPNR